MSSPRYTGRLSSRTLLLTNIPARYLSKQRLRRLYGDSVKHIWIPRTAKGLQSAVKERERAAELLEKAEIELIVKCHKARKKRINPYLTSISRIMTSPPTIPNHYHTNSLWGLQPSLTDEEGSASAQWITATDRPRHGRLSQLWRAIDTIDWGRLELRHLNARIRKIRHHVLHAPEAALPVAFLEFSTQEHANAAQQYHTHHIPLQMSRSYLGIEPMDLLWRSLAMSGSERRARRALVIFLITAAILLWSVPTAVISTATDLTHWSEGVPSFSWIDQIPKSLLQPLRGVIPALVLTLWVGIAPALLRCNTIPNSFSNLSPMA